MNVKLTRDDVEILNTDLKWDDNPPKGVVWHIKVANNYYVVSAVDLPFNTIRTAETMAFPANVAGEVTSWLEHGFSNRKDHWACIDDLLEDLSTTEGASL